MYRQLFNRQVWTRCLWCVLSSSSSLQEDVGNYIKLYASNPHVNTPIAQEGFTAKSKCFTKPINDVYIIVQIQYKSDIMYVHIYNYRPALQNCEHQHP